MRSNKTLLEVREPIRDIVKKESWQKVRQSLIGQWKSRPEWCCQQLRGWLKDPADATNDDLRIIMNYLTGSGFRMGRIKHDCITKLRGQVSNVIATRKTQGKWYGSN